MIGNIITPIHLIFVLAVALLVLGPKRLPEAGRGLGIIADIRHRQRERTAVAADRVPAATDGDTIVLWRHNGRGEGS
ncbi:MAG: twin-arginine translocase TatA/TatE family subunit [Solirubrobacteraceae bacterium]